MTHPDPSLPVLLEHCSEEPDYAVKMEKEDLIPERPWSIPYICIPESGPVKVECLLSPLDLASNTSEQQEELKDAVKIEKDEFIEEIFDEKPCPFMPEHILANDEFLTTSLDRSTKSTAQQEENLEMNYDCANPKLKIQKNVSVLTGNENLTNNTRIHSEEKSFYCDYCSAKFSKKGSLVCHIRTHSAEKPFGCNSCSAKFTVKGDLVRHLRTHTGEKSFECNSCSAKFARKSHLADHIQTHTGERPFECSSCSARFARRSHLVGHIRTHTGEKPFKCNLCSARFSQSSHLVSHIRTHTGEKPFVCDLCPGRFTQKGDLISHQRKHTDEKPYKCDSCSVQFKHRGSLAHHSRKHTSKES